MFILLLAMLLVWAQQAALVHEIGHGFWHHAGNPIASAVAVESQDSGTSDRGTYCDKCFQFAQVCSAATGFAPAALLLVACNESAHRLAVAELAADAPASRSRGPPIAL